MIARPDNPSPNAVDRVLGQPWMPWVAALLAVVLSLPSLDVGFRLDDLHHRAALSPTPARAPGYGLAPTAAGLFAFTTGSPDDSQPLIARGIFPWWTDPELTVRFFRPLAALTILLDHRWWPDRPRPMHWHTLAWVFACVLTVGLVYRRWLPPGPAGLAALLFAVDDAHIAPFAWLAQRNHLMAATFGMITLLAHDAWRRRGSRAAAAASVAGFLASLLSGEAGIATLALLAAYALFVDRGSVPARAASLLPTVLVAAGWRVWVVAAGYITRYSDAYLDPAAQPVAFLAAMAERLPLLLLGQWTPVRPEILLALPQLTPWLVMAGLIVMGLLALAFAPLLRRDRVAKACGVAMLLAVVPVCATFAHSRNLVFVGMGAMGLLALYLSSLPDTLRASGRVARWGHVSLAAALVVTHVVLAPALLWRGASLEDARAWNLQVPPGVDLTHRTVIALNGPAALLPAHFPLQRDAAGLTVPRSVHAIGPSMAEVDVERVDTNTLRLSSVTGWYRSPLDQLARSTRRRMPPGTEVALDVASIRVDEASPDGRPLAISCTFRTPLEDASLVWTAFVDGAYRPWVPPAPGVRIHFPIPALR